MTREIRREPVQILMANFLIPTPQGQTHLSYRKFAESTARFWCEFDTHIFIEIWFDSECMACLGEVMSAPFRGHTLVTNEGIILLRKYR